MTFEQKISGEIFQNKYMINGEISYDEVFSGVAKEIASVEKKKLREKWEEIFYDQISSGKLIPAGRILANARPGTKMPFYNNCYTISIDDSIEDIFEAVKNDAMISRTGGGVGINFSNLRPKDALLSKGGTSSGSVSFMEIINTSAGVIHTGGSRRAAHIAILNVDHPDIEEFITVKQGDKNKKLEAFNISVGVTDAFMHAVDYDLTWDLVFDGKVYKTVLAKELYELMTKNAFTHNEPGILNLDTINYYNNGYYDFTIQEVNPCGEIVMPAYSLCCLSALNLTQFIKNPFTIHAEFDWEEFHKSVAIGVRFLDNVLSATAYPLEKIEVNSKNWRRIGLGFTGLADTFAMLGIIYGSNKSMAYSSYVGKALRDGSYATSVSLAREKGKFPKCNNKKLVQSNFIKKLPESLQKDIRKYGMRNIALNTIAPTGTTSLSVGQNCSSGIEPIFSLSYDRSIRVGNNGDTKTETVHDYAWLKFLETIPEGEQKEIPEAFITTFDIDVYDAIDIQGVFQEYIDHSISKTLNPPTGTTYEEYNKLFKYAYKKGLKGFTTFNPEGSMKGIFEVSATPEKREVICEVSHSQKRPKELPCDIHQLTYKSEKYILLVGTYDDLPYEIFVTKNVDKEFDFNKHKAGKIFKSGKSIYSLSLENGGDKIYIEDIVSSFDTDYGTLGRFISMSLRHKVPLQFIVEQLNKDKNFMGFERTVSRVLKKYIAEGEKVQTSNQCPECKNVNLIYKEGCLTCPSCGWSKCS